MRGLAIIVLMLAGAVAMLAGPQWLDPLSLSPLQRDILLELRLPRVLFAALIGAMLGLSGSVYQLTLKNPLADSFTTGAASSSALGAVLAIALGVPGYWVSVCAFATGMAGLVLVYRMSQHRGRINPVTMILAGVVMNIIASAVISFAKYYFEDSLNAIVYWLMGGIFLVSWDRLALCAGLLALTYLFLSRRAVALNLLALDEASAQSLGVNVQRLRASAFVLSTLLVAVAVSFSGIIGFVGLIVPHVARSLFGSDMNNNLFYSAVMGSGLLVVSDAVSRVVIPGGAELPVGIITAVVGGGFFFYLLHTRRGSLWNG
ncbi:iron complex transport system permease protein [Ferrimonas sediminum]|uniref:Iron complex transport system permease protein n=1 Tax=Ferrimonas sediminum TaxID=718193 RepID=A0A1G8WMC3_9GAMM|nr:iron ABC transporter permease [Ferrimonas sediminum]SDJ78805.1 iron complex transport system permease protein [Ferrimonas sediminum]